MTAGIASVLTGCEPGVSAPSASEPKAAAKPVRVHRVTESAQELVVRADGSLGAVDQSTLSTKVAGRVRLLPVDLGTAVREGQLLAEIEPRDYELRVRQSEALLSQARAMLGLPLEGSDDQIEAEKTGQVRQARAVLDEARSTLERLRRLAGEGIVPKSDLDSAEAAHEVALSRYEDSLEDVRRRQALVAQRRVELDLARQELADTRLHAPFDGVVRQRRANLGEYVQAGAAIVTIVRMDPLRLQLEVRERDAPQIKSGQKLRLRLVGSTELHAGEIKRLSPVIENQTRVLRVEADVSNPKGALRPGSYASAEIVTGVNPNCLMIPKEALVVFAGIEKIFVVEEGRAVEKQVATGVRSGEMVEVLKGVQPGGLVVLTPGSLQTGQAVTVMN